MRIFHLLRSRNIVAIIVLLILISFIPCINSAPSISALVYDEGSLSGYVNDTNMDPIEGALVRVYFHGTYEENYSDSSGYYHVTNIPICYCLKNCTASKEGYQTEWVLLSSMENTTHDFVLSPITEYNGSLSGYVNDTNMDPIEGALVRVNFHGTYEEDYTDSSGHYHVTNIPICWCMKNCTASKEGYSSEWVLLGIIENTTHDFVLTPLLESIFIIGRITNLTSQGSTISFEAVSIWCITFSPFTIHKYTSGEKVIISIEYTGLLTTRIVFALCGALI